MSTLRQDLLHAVRGFRRAPAFTAVAILMLAVGIGATTSIFSLFYGILVRPLPYPEPERLFSFREGRSPRAGGVVPLSVTDSRMLEALESDRDSFEAVGGYLPRTYTLSGRGEPVRVAGMAVSPGLFRALRVGPAVGRFFRDPEARAGSEHVVVLSHAAWRARFAADPAIVGLTISLDGVAHEVVGVAPEGFRFFDRRDELWTPLVLRPPGMAPDSRLVLPGLGRLAAGVTIAKATAAGQAVLDGLYAGVVASGVLDSAPRLRLVPLRDDLTAEIRPALRLLFTSIALLLVAACANLSGLLLARGWERGCELGIRAALGARTRQLARLLLTESLVLAAAGGAGGVALAIGLDHVLRRVGPADLPRLGEARLDAVVLAFAIAAVIATGLAVGAVPALHAAATRLSSLSSSDPSGARAGSGWSRWGDGLAAAQITLTVVLLTGAGLLARSYVRLAAVDLGFEPRQVLSAHLALPSARYPQGRGVSPLVDSLLERVAALDGVEAVGVVDYLPATERWGYYRFPVEGRAESHLPESWAVALPHTTSEGYRDAIGLRLVAGRWFSSEPRQGSAPHRSPVSQPEAGSLEKRALDDGRAPPVAVVNQEFARRYLAGQDPLLHRLSLLGRQVAIVGVVADVRHRGPTDPLFPEVYFSYRQSPYPLDPVHLVVRRAGDPLDLIAPIRSVVSELDPEVPLAEVSTMDARIASTLARPRLQAQLLGAMSMFTLALAALGTYGALSWNVSRRRRELAIRRAVGAPSSALMSGVLGRAIALTAVGVALGLAAALALTRLLRAQLFGVEPTDPTTFAGVAVALGVVALVASYAPARRAASADPAEILRSD
jgi:putative ABC transport system permease protein